MRASFRPSEDSAMGPREKTQRQAHQLKNYFGRCGSCYASSNVPAPAAALLQGVQVTALWLSKASISVQHTLTCTGQCSEGLFFFTNLFGVWLRYRPLQGKQHTDRHV